MSFVTCMAEVTDGILILIALFWAIKLNKSPQTEPVRRVCVMLLLMSRYKYTHYMCKIDSVFYIISIFQPIK